MQPFTLVDFIRESNKIENIHREPLDTEVRITRAFLELEVITVADLQGLVQVYAPGHLLRDRAGLDVRIGYYYPPRGGPQIVESLKALLGSIASPTNAYQNHIRYEALHPFTDGNGRSGRALWLWQMSRPAYGVYNVEKGFLHTFYYQTLQNSNRGTES